MILGYLDIVDSLQVGQFIAIRFKRRQPAVLGDQRLDVAEIQGVEQHLFVIASEGHDVGIVLLELYYSLYDTGSVPAPVDKVAQKDYFVPPYIPGHVGYQLV